MRRNIFQSAKIVFFWCAVNTIFNCSIAKNRIRLFTFTYRFQKYCLKQVVKSPARTTGAPKKIPKRLRRVKETCVALFPSENSRRRLLLRFVYFRYHSIITVCVCIVSEPGCCEGNSILLFLLGVLLDELWLECF